MYRNFCTNFGTHSNYRNFARTLVLIRTFYYSDCTETFPELWHSFGLFTSQYVPKLCPNFSTHSIFLPLKMYRNFSRTLALIRVFTSPNIPKLCPNFGTHSNFLPLIIFRYFARTLALRMYRNFARTLALIQTFYLSECTETLLELWHSFKLFTSQNVPKLCPNFGTHSNFLPTHLNY
jgi:hypothetical protein